MQTVDTPGMYSIEDLANGLKILDETSSYGVDLKRLANDLLYYFRALLICRISAEPEKLLDVPDQEFDEMRQIAGQHTVETLQLYFNMLLKGVEDMQYSSHPRLAFEMALIRAAEAGNVISVADLLGKLESMQSGGVVASVSKPTAPRAPVPKPAVKEKAKTAALKKTDTAVVPEKPRQEQKQTVIDSKDDDPITDVPLEIKAPPRQNTEESAAENVAPPSTREVRKNWDEFIEYVMDRKKWMAHTLRLCSNVREEGTDLILKFDDPSDCKMLQTKENMKFLTEFSQDFFQKEFTLGIKIRGADSQGIMGQEGIGPQEERRALANDPLVQMATEVLGSRVVNIRTGPRSR